MKFHHILGVVGLFISSINAQNSPCVDLALQLNSDSALLEKLKSMSSDDILKHASDLTCICHMIKSNFFESADFMLEEQFSSDKIDKNTVRALS